MNLQKRVALLTFTTCVLTAMTLSFPVAAEKDIFTSLDTDADGKISKVEADGHAALRLKFDAIDSDADGFISKAELQKVDLSQ